MHMLALKLMFIFIFMLLFIRIAVKPVITLHVLEKPILCGAVRRLHIFKKDAGRGMLI